MFFIAFLLARFLWLWPRYFGDLEPGDASGQAAGASHPAPAAVTVARPSLSAHTGNNNQWTDQTYQ